MRAKTTLLGGTLLLSGCLPFLEKHKQTATEYPTGPHTDALTRTKPVEVTPASVEAASRVDFVGRLVVAKNPDLGFKPMFFTIGKAEPGVFHRGTNEVFVTEGLVKECRTDGQLAAVLSLELGKMAAASDAATPAAAKDPRSEPPMDVPLSNNLAAGGVTADMTRMAELAQFEEQQKNRPRPRVAGRWARPDPQVMGRQILMRAGFSDADATAVEPLLQKAAKNPELANQIAAPSPAPQWLK
jgi:hypothetical protein